MNNPRTNIQITIHRDGEDWVFQYVDRAYFEDGELVIWYAPAEGTYEILEHRFDEFKIEITEVTTVEPTPQ